MRGRQVLIRRGGFGFDSELGEAGVAPLRFTTRSFFSLLRARALGRLVFVAGVRVRFLACALPLGLFRALAHGRLLALRGFARRALGDHRIGRDRRRNRSRIGRGAIVQVTKQRARALRARSVAGPVRHLIEIVAFRQTLDGLHGRVLEFAVQRNVQDLAAIVHARQRVATDRFVGRMARDRAEHVNVADPAEGAPGRRLDRRGLRNRGQRLDVRKRAKSLDGGLALRLACALKRFEREVAQHPHRVCPHRFIAVAPGDVGERCRVHQFRHRCPTHPHVDVLARDLRQQLAIINGNFLNERQTNRRIGMLLSRLGTESVEQSHTCSRACCELRRRMLGRSPGAILSESGNRPHAASQAVIHSHVHKAGHHG